MATVTKYNLSGKEIGQLTVDDLFAQAEANEQMIKDYIIALRENARQWSANTKTRGQVHHTTKKVQPQKHTGGARHSDLAAPQFRGGGRAHGPKPKFDQHVHINKKQRRAAIRFLIGEKVRDNKLRIVDNVSLNAPKTKTVAQFLQNSGIKGRVLFLAEGFYEGHVSVASDAHNNFAKSVANLPKTNFALAKNVNGYDLLLANEIVLTEAAWNEINDWLK